MLIILAGRDDRVNATAVPWAEALRAAGKDARAITYPDVDHAFHNDTSAMRYNRDGGRAGLGGDARLLPAPPEGQA